MDADACGLGHSCTGVVHRSVPPFGISCLIHAVVPVAAHGSLLCPKDVWDLRVHNRLLVVHIPFRNFASKVLFAWFLQYVAEW